MATVYRAIDTRLGRTVAVKMLHPEFARDKPFLQRFQQEAEFAASLGAHPNIVDIYDIGQDGDLHYIVMEFVEGSTLKDLIRERRRFDVPSAFAIGQQVASALAFAHRRGLIHRDVKPQNILVTPEGQAKVTDFGIARGSSASQLTRTGMVIGTVHYFSPEQAQGQPLGPPSDIYSLGIILYEMLTGHLPFDAENAIGVAMQHIHSPPPNPADFNPSITPAAAATVLRALAKQPDERYRDANEFAAALAQGSTPSGTTVMSPIVPQPTTVYATAPLAAATRPVSPPVPARPTRTTTAARSTNPLLWALLGLLAVAVIAGGAFFAVAGGNPFGAAVHPTATATPRPTATAKPKHKKRKPTPVPTIVPAPIATTAPPTAVPPTAVPPTAVPTAVPTRRPRPTATPLPPKATPTPPPPAPTGTAAG